MLALELMELFVVVGPRRQGARRLQLGRRGPSIAGHRGPEGGKLEARRAQAREIGPTAPGQGRAIHPVALEEDLLTAGDEGDT